VYFATAHPVVIASLTVALHSTKHLGLLSPVGTRVAYVITD
jgi:hypothetical protein